MKIAIICPDDVSIILFCKEIISQLKNKNNKIYVLCDKFQNNNYYIDLNVNSVIPYYSQTGLWLDPIDTFHQ